MEQELRNKAADWLQFILDKITAIVAVDPSKFDFKKYVSHWDETHTCGTVCCMEGWLPAVIPDKVKWVRESRFGSNVVMISDEQMSFHPQCIDIPIDGTLWDWLTLPEETWGIGNDRIDNGLSEISSFEEVKAHWEDVIAEIRAGKLDEHIHY